MSSKNYRTIHPKSVLAGLEFEEFPYSETEKFNIFIPKQQDKISVLIEKDKMLNRAKST